MKTLLCYSIALLLMTSCVDISAKSDVKPSQPSNEFKTANHKQIDTLDFDIQYSCSNQQLNMNINMAKVYAYNNDPSLLIIADNSNHKLFMKLDGTSTVNTFNTTLNRNQVEQLILLTANPNSRLEIISYRSNNNSNSQRTLIAMSNQLRQQKKNCFK